MPGFSFQDLLNPPTPLAPRNGSVSPRGQTLWDRFAAGAKDVVNVMLRAGTERAVERFRQSPAGQEVRQEFIRQDVMQFLGSPVALVIGVVLIIVLFSAFRR